MALRGRSRESDESGVCGDSQKLVVTGDRYPAKRVASTRIFPGAKSQERKTKRSLLNDTKKLTNIDKLLRYLSSPGHPSRVDTEQIGAHFGRPWRKLSGDLTRRDDFDTLLANAWQALRGEARCRRGVL